MAEGGSNKKIANSLVAVSCGAVLAVYTAGYVRTQAAVDRFEAQAAERRRAVMGAPPSPAFLDRFQPRPPEIEEHETRRIHLPPDGKRSPAPFPESAATEVRNQASSTPAEVELPPSPVHIAEAPAAAPVAIAASEPAPAAEQKAAPKPDAVAAPTPKWKDGSYLGWGTSRHGDIQAEVVVDAGRIVSATIAQCRTRYSCSVIDRLPPQVAQRQSPDVDYVSGATQSADAFYFAVVDALSRAK